MLQQNRQVNENEWDRWMMTGQTTIGNTPEYLRSLPPAVSPLPFPISSHTSTHTNTVPHSRTKIHCSFTHSQTFIVPRCPLHFARTFFDVSLVLRMSIWTCRCTLMSMRIRRQEQIQKLNVCSVELKLQVTYQLRYGISERIRKSGIVSHKFLFLLAGSSRISRQPNLPEALTTTSALFQGGEPSK